MTFLAGRSLPRRTVLRGLGTALSLPLLEAMFPAMSLRAKAATGSPHRFLAFYVPNGMAMQYWSPKGEGGSFELSPILEPLSPFRDQMLVLSGLQASWNYIHAGASGSFLTGTTRGGRNEVEIIADVSMGGLASIGGGAPGVAINVDAEELIALLGAEVADVTRVGTATI